MKDVIGNSEYWLCSPNMYPYTGTNQMFIVHVNNFLLTVDYMLNYTDVDVVVYQGQLDLICDTKGNFLKYLISPLT